MSRALILSLLIHTLVVGGLFLRFEEASPVHQDTAVEFVTFGNVKKARQQRVKGSPKTITKRKFVRLKGDGVALKKEGSDSVDVKQIVSAGVQQKASAVDKYTRELTGYIEKNRYYPRKAERMGLSGAVKVKITIAQDGTFSGFEIIEPAKNDIFNRAAKNLFAELGSFKPLPSVYKSSVDIVVPIKYELKRGALR